MSKICTPKELTQIEVQIALTEVFPEATHGAISILNQLYALGAYRPRLDGKLSDDRRAFVHSLPVTNYCGCESCHIKIFSPFCRVAQLQPSCQCANPGGSL